MNCTSLIHLWDRKMLAADLRALFSWRVRDSDFQMGECLPSDSKGTSRLRNNPGARTLCAWLAAKSGRTYRAAGIEFVGAMS